MFEHLDDPNPLPVDGSARRAVDGRRLRILRRRKAGMAGAVSVAVVVAAGGVAFGVSGTHKASQKVVTRPSPPTAVPASSTSTTTTVAPPTTAAGPPVSPATTVQTPVDPLVCGSLSASSGPASASATDGSITAVLSGTQTSPANSVPYLADATLTVRSSGSVVLRMPVAAPTSSVQGSEGKGPAAWTTGGSSTSAAKPLGPLCLIRTAGSPYLSAVFTYYGYGAHCCFSISAIPVDGPHAGKQVFLDLGNFAAEIEVHAGNAVLRTADNRFAYAFQCYACSGEPVQVFEVQDGQLVDRTRDFPDLVSADATQWWSVFQDPQNAGQGNGFLAAWVADQCLLGRKTSAFATVDQLNRQGRLQASSGWPSGSTFISDLKTLLSQAGYC